MRRIEGADVSLGLYLIMEAFALGLYLLIYYGAGVRNPVAETAIALGLFVAAACAARVWAGIRRSRSSKTTSSGSS